MATNNLLLFNAALSGFVSGAVAGSYQTDATAADYAAIVTQATTFATAVDAAIANDNTISAANGTATTGAATSALVEGQSAKPQLLQALCFGAAFQRWETGAAADATTVAAVKAIYTEAIASQLFT